MKFRRHHNNEGRHKVRTGKVADTVEFIAKRLGIPYNDNKRSAPDWWLEATRKK